MQMIMAPTIILGIDPGTRITGYGIIAIDPHPKPLDFGCICPPPKLPLEMRYKILFDSLEKLVEKYNPTAIAVESQFVLKNAQSAIKLGMAKGMALLIAAKYNIPIQEFAPKKAKLAVVGHGSASKWQVQKMIQSILQLPTLPEPEDAADALALALCYSNQIKEPHVCIHPRNFKRKRTPRSHH